jgi:hypothetical protein
VRANKRAPLRFGNVVEDFGHACKVALDVQQVNTQLRIVADYHL